jgi:hypothetical protein
LVTESDSIRLSDGKAAPSRHVQRHVENQLSNAVRIWQYPAMEHQNVDALHHHRHCSMRRGVMTFVTKSLYR